MNFNNITSRWTSKDGFVYLKYADGSIHKESAIKNIPLLDKKIVSKTENVIIDIPRILNANINTDLCQGGNCETTDIKKNSTDVLKGVIVGVLVGLIVLGVIK